MPRLTTETPYSPTWEGPSTYRIDIEHHRNGRVQWTVRLNYEHAGGLPDPIRVGSRNSLEEALREAQNVAEAHYNHQVVAQEVHLIDFGPPPQEQSKGGSPSFSTGASVGETGKNPAEEIVPPVEDGPRYLQRPVKEKKRRFQRL